MIARHEVSYATLPPSALATLEPADVPSVVTLTSVGEALSAEQVARWAAGRRFVNGYGATETTIGVAISAPLAAGEEPDVGGPLANTRVFVLDAFLRPVPQEWRASSTSPGPASRAAISAGPA